MFYLIIFVVNMVIIKSQGEVLSIKISDLLSLIMPPCLGKNESGTIKLKSFSVVSVLIYSFL